ncbi:M23 family metallopeptidase [Nibricoccus sp. IMCC34717]|uniref:M23 family metallopeptidase n=1 Tax=Nibricoccus sp. IMCC34717 TaxID=3034021 RepID=UPI003850833F
MSFFRVFLSSLALLATAHAQRVELVWPTPNRAFMEGKGYEAFVQPTASGVAESGLFGSVRSGGAQFHEGIDLKPVSRDRRGEPADSVFAVMPGVVRHISRVAGNSNYGRYVVLEHPDAKPAIYTLYAHLASVDSALAVGQPVRAGEVLGIMGRSSSGQAIPRDRAHLHFEFGLALTQNFQPWYDAKKFGSRNDHGMWNGMNLCGFDPLDFFTQWRDRRVDTFEEYFSRMRSAVRVRVSGMRIPDFARRYPQLLTRPVDATGIVAGWEIDFTNTGLPFRLTPLTATELAGQPSGETRIVVADESLLRQCRGKHLAVRRGGGWTVGRDLKNNLELLFGVR